MPSRESREELINRSLYIGMFRITEAIEQKGIESYRQFFSEKYSARTQPLSLNEIEDIMLRRRICEFLYDSIDDAVLIPKCYYSYRLLVFKSITRRIPEYLKLPYNDFLNRSEEIVNALNIHNLSPNACLHSFRKYCNTRDHEDNPFDSDTWDISRFNLTFDRYYSNRIKELRFDGITDPNNKYLVKKYVENQLNNTGFGVTYIYSTLTRLRIMLNLVEGSYSDWAEDDVKRFAEIMIKEYPRELTRAAMIIILFAFTDYLLLHDFIQTSPIKKLKPMARTGSRYQHCGRSLDNTVIFQIYRALDKLNDQDIKLGFLILHSVGMRCSEMLVLKRNCIERREQNAFLNYYSVKMKKDVCNVIPLTLADMIEEYEKTLKPGEFLFPSKRKKDNPISYYYFNSRFNRFLTENRIVNPDGSPFLFSTHSMRHQMAVRMRENNVPLQFIQEQLHHSNIDMTLAYVEYLDRTKIKKMTQFLDANGEKAEFALDEELFSDSGYIDYMRRKINAQMLPNGVCARPVALGECQHGNCCLSCPEFRTSRKYLEFHRQQLERVKCYLSEAEKNGWLPQIESNKNTMIKLERLIEKLEALPDESIDGQYCAACT